MMRGTFLSRLRRDARGAMAIETAVVAPVLVLMSIGTFEVGTIVSRQQELQSSAAEAESIILAAAAGTGTDSATMEEVIEESLGLDADQVTLEQRFRCNVATTLTDEAADCDASQPIAQYVLLTVNDSYDPVWTRYGIAEGFDYNVTRTIQVQ
jgi:Flp pilus assembly protein TadG